MDPRLRPAIISKKLLPTTYDARLFDPASIESLAGHETP
jgi:hypothetical protein